MTVAMILEDERLIGPDLRWPLRIAALEGGELICIVPGTGSEKNGKGDSSQPAPTGDDFFPRFAEALDTYVGEGRWAKRGGPSKARGSDQPVGPVEFTVRLRVVPADRLVEAALALVGDRKNDLLLFVTTADRDPEGVHERFSLGVLRSAVGRITAIVPGRHQIDGNLLTTVSDGPHARAAMRLASRLAKAYERPLAAVYVEPDLGPEAEPVGRRMLDRILAEALDGDTAGIERRVEIDDRVVRGVLRACEDDACDAVFAGSARIKSIGTVPRGIASKLARGLEQPTLIAVRSSIRLRNRALRFVDDAFHRFIPQLTREERTDLVERIQSNSRWNFDFVALTGLSTVIAAMGLIDNSAAVIIGAMLVAPLMTPLLGLGLALSQGNVQLVKMTLRTVTLGFLTAFAIGLFVGELTPGFVVSTPEMAARDWPGFLDLVIAFAAGLAAAYASGRPGLLAALPGVAIAAALLPPIATSGLASSIGNYHLAAGSMLLFLVNIVAIVFASYLSLWAVGIRFQPAPRLVTRILRNGLAVLILATALTLTLAPSRSAPPPELVAAIDLHLEAHRGDSQLRARRLRLVWDASGNLVLQIDLGGARHLTPQSRRELLDIARVHLGEAARVRLTFRHEVHLE